MKKSSGKQNQSEAIALYKRVSREDELAGESCSIQNQHKILVAAAKEKGYTRFVSFIDDGISGTIDKREEFQKMLAAIERGEIKAVFVKDLSRLTRDQSTLLELMRRFFSKHGIRLVSVTDGIDTAQGEDDLLTLRGAMNEMYALDISKKRRATNKVKGHAGEPLPLPPYGYMKDPENPKRWIVDEDAAATVRYIFQMKLEGKGTGQIAATLTSEKVLTPTHYWASKGIRRGGSKSKRVPFHWNHSSILKLLSLQEYCGDVINFKTHSKSLWLKERVANSEENMAVFQDVHEAIIERSVWEQVQQPKKSRSRKMKTGERNIFSGLLTCSECGKLLHHHINSRNSELTFFSCSNAKANRGTCETTHYIRADFLEQVVLLEVRRLTQFAKHYEDEFAKLVMGHSLQASQDERSSKRKEVYAKNARIREIDKLIERLYEDNISGKLSDERFARMTANYETEQGMLMEEVKQLTAELSKEESSAVTTGDFIQSVRNTPV